MDQRRYSTGIKIQRSRRPWLYVALVALGVNIAAFPPQIVIGVAPIVGRRAPNPPRHVRLFIRGGQMWKEIIPNDEIHQLQS